MTSSRELLLQKREPPKQRVELPEFGPEEYVWIHGMTAREKNAHDASMMKADWSGVNPKKAKTLKERLVVKCARDEDGNQIFQLSDIDAIGDWSAQTLDRLYDVAHELNEGSAKPHEATVKNSDETGGDC